jgi:hypothetical protein
VAAIDVTQEAILNSLLAADAVTGFRGYVRHAVPLDRGQELCQARGACCKPVIRPGGQNAFGAV